MKPVRVPDLRSMKERGEKIAALTAYDVTMARLLDRAGAGRRFGLERRDGDREDAHRNHAIVIEMFSGGCAFPAPVTLICNSTIWPTTASELLKTAVTLGGSANARLSSANAINAPSKTAMGIRDRCIDISINH